MKNSIFLILTLFVSLPAFAQLTNLDFENWHLDSTGISRLDNWEHLSYYNGMPGGVVGTWADSNAEHGAYAIKISRWYGYVKDWIRQKAPISSKPSGITGYYKYVDNTLNPPYNTDSGLVAVFLTKWNGSTGKRDTLGRGRVELQSTATYSAFNCPINYTSSSTPDSIILNILPSSLPYNNGMCTDVSGRCSYLTVDNLVLSAPTVVTHITTATADIYPNPVKDQLVIQQNSIAKQITVRNTIGQTIFETKATDSKMTINTATWPAGVYFISIIGADASAATYKILKE